MAGYNSGNSWLDWQVAGAPAGGGGDQVHSQNLSNYGNILDTYNRTNNQITNAMPGITAGYGALNTQVQGMIQGVDRSQRQAIADAYAKQSGQMSQSMISHGLGNTTVQGSMQRGLTLDKQKADIALSNQMAQLQAGYSSQLGMAGLQSQMQGLGLQTGLGTALMGDLSHYQLQYPPSGRGGGGGGPKGQQAMSPFLGGGGGDSLYDPNFQPDTSWVDNPTSMNSPNDPYAGAYGGGYGGGGGGGYGGGGYNW